MNANANTQLQSETQPDNRGRVLRSVGRAAMLLASIALPMVAIVGAAIAGVVMFTSVEHLGETTLVVNAEAATLVAASVTVTLLLLMVTTAALALTGKRRTLLIAGLFTLAWLALGVLMSILDTAITVSRIQIDATLLLIGEFIYSMLPALPVVPLVTLAVSAAHERHEQYPTIASAGGAMLLSMLKVLLTVATFAFESFFGISLGLNPVAAVFAATLNATAFALALGNVDAARHEGDRQGVNTWGTISTGYALLMFVIAIEAILTLSKGAGAEGTLAAMHAPQWLETLALWAFVSSIGLSALLIALTFWRKAARSVVPDGLPPAKAGVRPADDVVTIRRPIATRIADGIRAAGAGGREIGSAWRDARGLPAPVARTSGAPSLAKDVPGDATAEVVTGDDAAADGARRPSKSSRRGGAN